MAGKILVLGLLLLALSARAQDISKVPAAQTVEEAHHLHQERLSIFIEHALHQPMRPYRDGGFFETAIARILSGQNTEEVNQVILSPETRAYAEVGTDFDGVLGACKRKGDYDFKLTELIPVTYEGIKRGVLSQEAYNKILSQLLTVFGNQHQVRVNMGGCFKVPETENHLLMIESARYLTNQLWHRNYPGDGRFDNEKNGFNVWFLKHLQQFLKKDFEEYNSRPYQGHSIAPLLNLINYAEDQRVRLAATMVMDYLSAKFAVQSSRLRRSAPVCRQHEYSVNTSLLQGDHMTSIFAQLAGNTDIYRFNRPAGFMTYAGSSALNAGMGSYRPHDLILDMIINNDQLLEQRVRHDGVESYYKHPKFVVSAGGRYLNRFDAGMKKRDGWAYPTSIMSNSGAELDRSQLVRFEGARDEMTRNNMCQFKNFACGMNFRLPVDLPSGCLVERGEWKFINYNSPDCPQKFGYYIAVRVRPYPAPGLFQKRVADNYGLFEVVDAHDLDFDQFMQTTLQNNQGGLSLSANNVYVTQKGDRIGFDPGPVSLERSPIINVNGAATFSRKFSEWNFLSGNVLSSRGDGRIEIRNPKMGLTLVLDYRDPLRPEKNIIQTGP